jgi:hypothetical protein
MNSRARILTLSAGIVLASVSFSCRRTERSKEIPLKDVVATFNQPELSRYKDRMSDDWEGLRAKMTSGVSNVIMVAGKDIHEAIHATRLAFTLASYNSDAPSQVDSNNPKSEYWICAYLGSDSSTPPRWNITRIDVVATVISIHYRRHEAKAGTDDLHRYFIWVPLGQLRPGNYTVQLCDSISGESVLRRLVRIKG